MWACPRCGRQFAARNQTHTCLTDDPEVLLRAHLSRAGEAVRSLYDRFVTLVEACGPVIILPERSRIAFQVRMSFAQVRPARRWLDGHLVLARAVADGPFRKVETFSARNHAHHFRVTTVPELEAVAAYLPEAYAVGEQRHLAR
jgi:hypothetical protein